MMPVMDGAVTIKALRRIDPKVKIVAMSGLVQSSDSHFAADATAYLYTPLNAATLLTAVREVLESSS
jgi:CheY-like chemotaxis protein